MSLVKPDPEQGATEMEICNYLLRASESKLEVERRFDESNDATRMGFISMAFSIGAAFLVERLFKNVVGPMLYGVDSTSAMTDWQKYGVQVLWFVVCFLSFPFSQHLLRKVSDVGCRQRSIWEDALILWKMSTNTMVVWSFKDTALSAVTLLAKEWLEHGADGEPSDIEHYWFNTYSSVNVVDCFKYFVIASAVLVLGLALALFMAAGLKVWSEKHPKVGFARKWVESSPFLLGIGMTESRIIMQGWYWTPWGMVNQDVPLSVYSFAVRAVMSLVSTIIAVFFMKSLQQRQKRYAAPLARSSTKVDFMWLRDYCFELFVGGLPFSFAYQWSQLGYEAYFHAIFDCQWPFHDCGRFSLWMWAAYSSMFALLGYISVPPLQATAQVFRKLDKFYARTLLRRDKHYLREQRISQELMATFFSIGLGWAFTNIVLSECLTDVTPTCPATLTVWSAVKYLLTVLCFLVCIAAGFHTFMSGYRLRARACKVTAIEEGNANQLFREIDEDGDGTITLDELKNFLHSSGLDSELFVQAFESLDRADGAKDGRVRGSDLVREFLGHIEAAKAATVEHVEEWGIAPNKAGSDDVSVCVAAGAAVNGADHDVDVGTELSSVSMETRNPLQEHSREVCLMGI